MNFEILAPAGSRESLIAGVRSGANAVYLGGKLFNARRNAGNFDDEELKSAVEYCHMRDVKVYLTLNILVADREFSMLYQTVKTALEAGVDAFIVQDIGVAKMITEHFPQARLHAFTQMTLLTPSAVKEAQSMGFKRVVLPRETTLDEIKEIKESTSAELEIFVHGALCMSVSGQCFLSSMIGSRNGNRGLCAQPCRLPFTAGGNTTNALSLKDLSLIKELALLDGITSLKIEGRMKRPKYVSAAVTAVRKAVNGEYTRKDEDILRNVFSRSGITNGYLKDERGHAMFGIRSREDVVSANSKLLKQISRAYDSEVLLVPLDMEFVCKSNKPSSLTAFALGKTVSVFGAVPESALNKPITEASVTSRLSKLGGTQFYANDIKTDIENGFVLSAAEINDMRRRAVNELNKTEPKTVNAKPFNMNTAPYIKNAKNSKPYATASFQM
ncbi:MAG: U32 family peptidase [Clostridiales bacterium]|nr:U32 family peptidase [Clostridiales bacterium]